MDFYHQLPKLELHAHLNGSVSLSTLKHLVQRKPELQHIDIEAIATKGDSLERVFAIFDLIYKVVNDLEAVRIVTRDVINEFAEDNVRYLELRTTLRPKHLSGFDKEEYLLTVLDEIDRSQEQLQQRIIVKLIVSVDRKGTLEDALDTVELAQKHRHRGIVGIDLCGDPMKGQWQTFEPAFLRARQLGFKLTLHAAEVVNYPETKEIIMFRPDRLGHASFLTEELKELVSSFRIPLELCLSSNIKSQAISNHANHHFLDWHRRKHPVCLCTDDKGVFSCTLSSEYQDADAHYAISFEGLFQLSLRSIDLIFGEDSTKEHLRKLWHSERAALHL